jgi:predicted porin
MKKSLIFSSLALAASFNTFAEDFTSEIGVVFVDGDNVDTYSLAGRHYFAPVDTSKGPLAEAAFLDRSNEVNLGYIRAETDDFGNASTWVLGGRYQIEDSGLFINASTLQFNGSDAAVYDLGLGYYISNDWTVSIDTAFDDDIEYTGLALSTKKLLTLGGDRFLNLEATINVPDEGDDSYVVGADYYFTKNLSVGLDYAWADSFSDGGTVVNANWFVTPTTALSLRYADDSVSDILGVGLVARF